MSDRTSRSDRVALVPGDAFRAVDMQAIASRRAWLRGLHARFVHGTWGIVTGFGVRLSPAADQLIVSPGLAIDACGREIVLLEERTVTMVPGTRWLTIAIRVNDECERPAELPCIPGPTPPAWRVLLRKITSHGPAPRFGIDVQLARVPVMSSTRFAAPDLSQVKYARAARRPRLASGVARAVQWERRGPLAWKTTFELTNARFERAPLCFVTCGKLKHGETYLGPFVSVDRVDPGSAEVTVTYASLRAVTTDVLVFGDIEPPGSLSWVAVDTHTGCPLQALQRVRGVSALHLSGADDD